MRAGETVKMGAGDYSCSNFGWLRQFPRHYIDPEYGYSGCHAVGTVALDLLGGCHSFTRGLR